MDPHPLTEPGDGPRGQGPGEQDPVDLLIAFEEASEAPIRPEYLEGTVIVPPPPDYGHGKARLELTRQLYSAGVRWAGTGMGFREGLGGDGDGGTRTLVIPDFHILKHSPTEQDEAHYAAHRGWYPMGLLALVGEVTSDHHETDTGPKYRGYAAAEIPVYVLVNREDGRVYVHSEPGEDPQRPGRSRYRTTTSTELGGKLALPAPYPVLDTSALLP
ncbi:MULTISPECIES: Uma2 family endonuclease [Streptomyces]|uniref:Uma2 family endonuclease n=1 Tax=Streptomyces TaxID=1883 RepID=UPI00163BFD95|nr:MULTISPECIES: Uma2 family endonuclease [Streptomyces]MBC2875942.1 Uma2 family endonuclease [Streptomyces sp. TYQ1024]UBI38312.1 Uma2 family endonuclease [Streptomyces mobaraensis]UKW30897.1 Uma2 family endonuclease [Streptomyces sp. TYQ1024]